MTDNNEIIRRFKGGPFKNRYKFEGMLTALSPLHIGDGDMTEDKNRLPKTDKMDKNPQFNTVMVDDRLRAYIPGSTLKGNLRAWITRIFTEQYHGGMACINDVKRVEEVQNLLKKDDGSIKDAKEVKEILRRNLKTVEFLFGSMFNEGKLEFWDGLMERPPHVEKKDLLVYSGYSSQRGTIVMKSVAIDIYKGTAAKNKLYNYEAVPRGASFKLTVSGQNLDEHEVGMLLFALDGFNSFIYPVTLGAMGGVGFGRFQFDLQNVYCLDHKNYREWITGAVNNCYAGYEGLKPLEGSLDGHVQRFKTEFSSQLTKEPA